MRIALIGVSGSGKGEQARRLAGKYRICHISTGDLLRGQSRQGHLNTSDQHALETGELASDEVVRELLEERLRRRDTKRGFVIDGYPRNIPQAQSLDNLLGMLGRPLQIAIYTDMRDDLLIKHNVGRQVCTACGHIFNKYFSPPTTPDICDHCGAPLGVRKKDTPRAVALRVAEHKKNTIPLITYFRAQHKLRTVAATGTVEEIHHKVCSIVDMEVRPLEIEAVVSATDSVGDEVNTVIAGGQINRIVPARPSGASPQPPPPSAADITMTGQPTTRKIQKKRVTRKAAAITTRPSDQANKKASSQKIGKKKISGKKISTGAPAKNTITATKRLSKQSDADRPAANENSLRQS